MEITIKLNIERQGKYLLCKDTQSLALALGTKAAVGDYKVYGVEKTGKVFKIHEKIIKARMKTLTNRIQKQQNDVEIMKNILQVKDDEKRNKTKPKTKR